VFTGWFGPRGLASIVLGLVYLKQEPSLAGESTIRLTVMVTVLLSIFCSWAERARGHKPLCQRLLKGFPQDLFRQAPTSLTRDSMPTPLVSIR
jgi:hypothetical protein